MPMSSAESLNEIPAAEAWQAQIQQNDIRLALRQVLPSGFAVGTLDHVEAEGTQVFGESLASVPIIVNDQAAWHGWSDLQEVHPALV